MNKIRREKLGRGPTPTTYRNIPEKLYKLVWSLSYFSFWGNGRPQFNNNFVKDQGFKEPKGYFEKFRNQILKRNSISISQNGLRDSLRDELQRKFNLPARSPGGGQSSEPQPHQNGGGSRQQSLDFDVPPTEVLNSEAQKNRAELARQGSLRYVSWPDLLQILLDLVTKDYLISYR